MLSVFHAYDKDFEVFVLKDQIRLVANAMLLMANIFERDIDSVCEYVASVNSVTIQKAAPKKMMVVRLCLGIVIYASCG